MHAAVHMHMLLTLAQTQPAGGAVSVLGAPEMQPWFATLFTYTIDGGARWIWNTDGAASSSGAPVNTVPIKFTKTYFLTGTRAVDVTIFIEVDNQAEVVLNSVSLGTVSQGWEFHGLLTPQLRGTLQPGENVLEVRAVNTGGKAGLLVSVKRFLLPLFHTDASWTWQ